MTEQKMTKEQLALITGYATTGNFHNKWGLKELILTMTEQIRNQHKNTMKGENRPLGQSSMLQFGDEDLKCQICGMSESEHDTEKCIEEYDC